jgi:hypothetical protein
MRKRAEGRRNHNGGQTREKSLTHSRRYGTGIEIPTVPRLTRVCTSSSIRYGHCCTEFKKKSTEGQEGRRGDELDRYCHLLRKKSPKGTGRAKRR